MNYHLLGHSPKLGSTMSAMVWNLLLNDPLNGDVPTVVSKKSKEFKDCWEFVLECLVNGAELQDLIDVDLEALWDNIDHDELLDYLNAGMVIKLDMVEHGYFSATLTEAPANAVGFESTQ